MGLEERIGDNEREAATSLLGDHYTEGRLEPAEYSERLDAIWSARTRGDLDQLFWDLPALAPAPATRPVAGPPARASRPGRLGGIPLPLLLLGCLLAVLILDDVKWLLLGLIGVLLLLRSRRHRHVTPHPSGDRYRR